MAFDVLEVETKHNRPMMASISYMRPTRKGAHKVGVKPQLIIAIPTVIAAITKKQFFQLQIGKGQDAGKARVSAQNTKNKFTVEPKEMKHCRCFNFGYVPILGNDIAGQEHIPVRKISDDEFEIDLPAWFKPSSPISHQSKTGE